MVLSVGQNRAVRVMFGIQSKGSLSVAHSTMTSSAELSDIGGGRAVVTVSQTDDVTITGSLIAGGTVQSTATNWSADRPQITIAGNAMGLLGTASTVILRGRGGSLASAWTPLEETVAILGNTIAD